MAALTLAALTVLFTAGACNSYSDEDDFSEISGKSYLPKEKQELILQTIEDGDYNAWKKKVEKYGSVSGIIDEINFRRFVEAREYARNGDYDHSLEIGLKLCDSINGYFAEKMPPEKGYRYFSLLQNKVNSEISGTQEA